MILATDYTGLAAVISALAAFVTAFIGLRAAWNNGAQLQQTTTKVEEVHDLANSNLTNTQDALNVAHGALKAAGISVSAPKPTGSPLPAPASSPVPSTEPVSPNPLEGHTEGR